eukprot:scaffold7232_cov310-Ochromonas_danica.AAC.6
MSLSGTVLRLVVSDWLTAAEDVAALDTAFTSHSMRPLFLEAIWGLCLPVPRGGGSLAQWRWFLQRGLYCSSAATKTTPATSNLASNIPSSSTSSLLVHVNHIYSLMEVLPVFREVRSLRLWRGRDLRAITPRAGAATAGGGGEIASLGSAIGTSQQVPLKKPNKSELARFFQALPDLSDLVLLDGDVETAKAMDRKVFQFLLDTSRHLHLHTLTLITSAYEEDVDLVVKSIKQWGPRLENLDLTYTHVLTNSILQAISSSCPLLKRLTLRNNGNRFAILSREIFIHCLSCLGQQNLIWLSITSQLPSSLLDDQVIESFLPNMLNLEGFVCHMASHVSDDYSLLPLFLSSCPRIRCIELHDLFAYHMVAERKECSLAAYRDTSHIEALLTVDLSYPIVSLNLSILNQRPDVGSHLLNKYGRTLTSFTFSGKEMLTDRMIRDVMKEAPNLKALHFKPSCDMTFPMKVFQSLQSKQSLDGQYVWSIAKQLKELSFTHFNTMKNEELGKILSHCCSLTSLSIVHGHALTDQAVFLILTSCPDLQQLELLDLPKMTADGVCTKLSHAGRDRKPFLLRTSIEGIGRLLTKQGQYSRESSNLWSAFIEELSSTSY